MVSVKFSLSYDVPWVEGLKLKGLYSYDYIMNDNKEFEILGNHIEMIRYGHVMILLK